MIQNYGLLSDCKTRVRKPIVEGSRMASIASRQTPYTTVPIAISSTKVGYEGMGNRLSKSPRVNASGKEQSNGAKYACLRNCRTGRFRVLQRY